ncbi:GNAT family N-acetyltransferase [Roseovarius ramblicola]|uniref:GNAT family N-acetyltransferase n=1 Tax=Roseovarius ramblicola TaxID=2022336 RepID=A0ABV5HY60_9RHOB
MMPDIHALYAVTEATWPPAGTRALGPVTIRDGRGGGKRVSAATVAGAATGDDLDRAEAAMRALGQGPLFQVRTGDGALDAMLAARGYRTVDPVNLHVAPVAAFTCERLPRVTTFTVWEPLEIMRDIWAEGGIGPARVAVMARAAGPKTGLFGRLRDQPAAAGFVAIHDGIAMVHALEVRARHRRAGLGRLMMLQAAHWAAGQGARHLAVICTQANQGANGLYSAMGFSCVGTYHYRQKEEP